MSAPQFLVVCGILALLIVAFIVLLVVRLAVLTRLPGALQCSYHKFGSRRWRTGILRLQPHELQWYPSFALTYRPSHRYSRSLFVIESHMRMRAEETFVVVNVLHGEEHFTWAMSDDAFSGLVSWIDAAPPSEEPVLI